MQRLLNPRLAAAQLLGSKDRYKIKLKSLGHRLVYEVKDRELLVLVIAIGKRERSEVCKTAHFR
jgi:mRNA interferase RelE/StbE